MGRTSPPTMVNFPRQIIYRPKEDPIPLKFHVEGSQYTTVLVGDGHQKEGFVEAASAAR